MIIEPFNPSSGYDIANVWDRSWPYFVRHGDVFVGWTSRYESIRALKGFEPQRYTPLTWGENSTVDDGITFDIAAQIGALFKRGGPRSPLHGLKVRHVFEAGFSQDGAFTFTQADVFNAIDRLPNGRPVYDGYVPGGTVGPSDINFGLTPTGSLPPGDPRNRMQPRDSPVIQINTETEEVLLGGPTGLAYRRPDSNARNDRYRLWEVPGASHISNDLGSSPTTEERDLAEIERIPLSRLPATGCAHQQYQSGPWVGVDGAVDPNPYPFGYVADAAFADLTKWLDDGTPPPRAPRIQVTDTRAGTTARDRLGNARGGLRTPFVDVPTATYSPIDSSAHETDLSGLCPLIGFSIPLSHATLRALYPSHADYVARVRREANELVDKGFWVAPDAATSCERPPRPTSRSQLSATIYIQRGQSRGPRQRGCCLKAPAASTAGVRRARKSGPLNASAPDPAAVDRRRPNVPVHSCGDRPPRRAVGVTQRRERPHDHHVSDQKRERS